jgi:hypothetical protein
MIDKMLQKKDYQEEANPVAQCSNVEAQSRGEALV